MADTRKDKRTPVSLKVRFKSATLDEFVEQYANDISRGGIFIKSKKPMKIGTLLKFEFQLKDESSLIHGVGRVVWKREVEDSGGKESPPGMGIKFIKMDAESRALVQDIVEGRGGLPGSFEKGEDGPEAGFFPDGPAAEQPSPEDRTSVRHASEFLAEALTESTASEEAAKNAEAARKRTEEIQRQRAQAEEARKAAEAGRVVPTRGASATEEAKSAEADDLALPFADMDSVPAPAVPEPDESKAASKPESKAQPPGRPAAADPAPEKAAPAPAAREPSHKVRPPAAATSPSTPPSEPESSKLPLILLLLLVVGGGAGGYYWWTTQQAANTDIAATEEAPEPVVEPEPEPEILPEEPPDPDLAADEAMVTIEVTSSVPGAVFVDGVDKGSTPAEVELPIGREVQVQVRADGYAEATQAVTATEGQEPLSFELEAMPYILEVVTEPRGARVSAAGRTIQSPGEIRIASLERPVTVTASLAGYRTATAVITSAEFQARDDAMRRVLRIQLLSRGATMRATMASMRPTMEAATMEAAMEAATMEAEPPPAMEPEPSPMEAAMEAAPMEAAMTEPGAGAPLNPF